MLGTIGLRHPTTLLLVATLATASGCSETTPADPDAGMKEIYFLSGAKRKIEDLIPFFDEAMAQQRTHLTEAQFDTAMRVIRDEMSIEKMEGLVLDRLEERAAPEYLDETLEWLRSPLGERAMEIEHASWTSERMIEMVDFMRDVEAKPPSRTRRELIERFDVATRLSELNAEMMLLSAFGVAVMIDALKPEQEQLGIEELQKSMDSQRQLLRPLFKETTAITSLFAFRDLTDEEIEAYVIFCESDAGQWFTGALSGALLDALLATTKNLGNVFIAALSRPSPS